MPERPQDSAARWSPWLPAAGLLAFRLLLLAALPYDALFAYGDQRYFFALARLAALEGGGLPWIGHWVEFPPLFPYLSLGLFTWSGGIEHLYVYGLALLMTVFDLGSLLLFGRLARRVAAPAAAMRLAWLYAAFLALPAFGWWTFEPMAVFWMLLALERTLAGRPWQAGAAAGIGLLTKFVPALALVVAWRFRTRGHALRATLVAAAIGAAGLAPFFVIAPEMAAASLRSQAAKGSWQTVWALIDGNLRTGTFGAPQEHLDPAQALRPRGAPAAVPLWATTLAFAGLGLALFVAARRAPDRAAPGFLALAWCVLFLWARGWSPQWLAYLAPLLALALPTAQAVGFGLNLAGAALLEWPVLLSRGRFDLLYLTVPLRTALLILLAAVLTLSIRRARTAPSPGEEP